MMKLKRNWRVLIGCGVLMLVTAGCFQNVNDAESQNVASQLNTLIPSDTPTETPPPPPTDMPTETATATPTPSPETVLVSDIDIGGGTSVAQAGDTPVPLDDGQVDEFELTATQIVAEITQTVYAAGTMTAIAQGIGATTTPFPTFTPELPPGITPTAPVISAPPGTVCIHEVKAGENLFRLSMTYGVSVNDLAAASGITNINLILVGDRVTIPGCGTTGVFPPPTSTPATLAQNAGTTGVDASAQTVPNTTVAGQTHIVQQYETLFQISVTYGVPVASIANANGITNINMIKMGDQLIIPAQ